MNTTFGEGDDDWAIGLFSEEELLKLRRAASEIEEDHVESQQVELVSVETIFERQYVHEIVAWLRQEHYNQPEGTVSDFLWAVGCNICFVYLVDVDWDYDEVLSDHATYFGARMFLDDQESEGDDDDVDDDGMDETDDETQ